MGKNGKGEAAECGEGASMNWALFGLTSEQVTFALVIAIGLFFLYLQLQRFARLGRSRGDSEPGPDDSKDVSDNPDEPTP